MVNDSLISRFDKHHGLMIQGEIGEFGGNIIMYFMIAIIFPIISGNCLFFHVYRGTPELKIPIHLLLANLAVTDLAVGIIVIPYDLIKLYGPFGLADHEFTCMLTFYFTNVLLNESGLTILLISIVRFILVIRQSHIHSEIWITKFKIKVLIVLTWIYTLGIYAFVGFAFNTWKPGVTCNEKLVSGNVGYIFTMAHGVLFRFSTAGFNFAFIRYINKRKILEPDTVKLEKKKAKMVSAVIVCYYTCWIPLLVYHVFCVIKPAQSNSVHANIMKWIAIVVMQSNSFLNPLIYVGFNPTFRQGYANALSCIYNDKIGLISFKRPISFETEHKSLQADENREFARKSIYVIGENDEQPCMLKLNQFV